MGIRDLHLVFQSIEHPITLKWIENLRVAIDGHGWLHRCNAKAENKFGFGVTEDEVLGVAFKFFAMALNEIILSFGSDVRRC